MTLLGAGIVIVSTVYITLREARLGKPKPTASARVTTRGGDTGSQHGVAAGGLPGGAAG